MRSRTPAIIVAAISLSNVVFLEQWRFLLSTLTPAVGYYVTDVSTGTYVGLAADVVLLGCLAAFAVTRAQRAESLLAKRALFGLLGMGMVLVLNSLRRELSLPLSSGGISSAARLLVTVAAVAAAGVFAALLITAPRRALHAAKLLGLVLSPLAAYDLGTGAIAVVSGRWTRAFGESGSATPAARADGMGSRVVMILFDEMDYRLMFASRPQDLELPNFDRLARTALFADSAIPPATETELSVASMLTRRKVVATNPLSARELLVRFADDSTRWSRLSRQPNMFQELEMRGDSIAVIGWTNPYCRLFGSLLTYCHSRGLATPPVELVHSMLWFLAEAVTVGPWVDRAYGFGLPYHSLDYVDLTATAERQLARGNFDVAFVHLPVPHMPRVYDRKTKQMTPPERYRAVDYFDNLALADVALGRLLGAISKSPIAASAAIIVTSDHPFRKSTDIDSRKDPRVPFIVLLPGARAAAHIGPPLETVNVARLVTAIRSDRVHSAGDVVREMAAVPAAPSMH